MVHKEHQETINIHGNLKLDNLNKHTALFINTCMFWECCKGLTGNYHVKCLIDFSNYYVYYKGLKYRKFLKSILDTTLPVLRFDLLTGEARQNVILKTRFLRLLNLHYIIRD